MNFAYLYMAVNLESIIYGPFYGGRGIGTKGDAGESPILASYHWRLLILVFDLHWQRSHYERQRLKFTLKCTTAMRAHNTNPGLWTWREPGTCCYCCQNTWTPSVDGVELSSQLSSCFEIFPELFLRRSCPKVGRPATSSQWSQVCLKTHFLKSFYHITLFTTI